MHAKASLLFFACLALGASVPALAQGRAESPFASAAASSPVQSSAAASSAGGTVAASVAAPVVPASGAQGTSPAPKATGALLVGAPTIAQLSNLQQAALQADARKKAAELYAAPEAASAPTPAVIRRIDPYGGAVPKPAPALLRVAAIVGRTGAESVEIRDAAGRVAVYVVGMAVGDWRLVEVRTDAILLRKVDEQPKVEAPRQKKKGKVAKPAAPTGPMVRLVPIGGEFPAAAS